MTGKIALQGLTFHAYHGVYAHERANGNNFEVDVIVEADFTKAALQDDLGSTVDYEELYEIVKHEMAIPSRLIETVAEKIIQRVMDTWETIIQAEVKISKLKPPIPGPCERATVMIVRKR